jgi:hypothetical protein
VVVMEGDLSFKPVLMHSCRRASVEVGPLGCRCNRRLTARRAKELVREGMAVFRTLPGGGVDDKEIVLLVRELPKPARTIDRIGIEGAYVLGRKYEQQRIDVYREVP